MHAPVPSDVERSDERPRGFMSGDRLLSWRPVAAVWFLPMLADAAGMYFGARVSGRPAPFWPTAARVAPAWGVWIPLTAALFWLVRRAPLWRDRPDASGGPAGATRRGALSWRAAAAYAAASVAAAFAHVVVLTGIARVAAPDRGSWGAQLTMTFEDWLPISLLLAWMTLGAAVALARVREAREQERRAAALEARLAQAELAVLRAQLEPHFLFNALNTAVSLVRAGEPVAGVDVLTRLADVLRHLLDGVAQETRLADELQLLESYLGIARARFGARLAIHVDVPPTLGDTVVPGLALQPLVENALRHGVGRREGPGHVWVDAWTAVHDAAGDAALGGGRVLWLRVRDDGPGLRASTSDAAADAREPYARTPGTGVGLRNLRDRLERLYGSGAAGLTLCERDGGGAEAALWLPLRHAAAVDGGRPA